jgi:hypothetical protein
VATSQDYISFFVVFAVLALIVLTSGLEIARSAILLCRRGLQRLARWRTAIFGGTQRAVRPGRFIRFVNRLNRGIWFLVFALVGLGLVMQMQVLALPTEFVKHISEKVPLLLQLSGGGLVVLAAEAGVLLGIREGLLMPSWQLRRGTLPIQPGSRSNWRQAMRKGEGLPRLR